MQRALPCASSGVGAAAAAAAVVTAVATAAACCCSTSYVAVPMQTELKTCFQPFLLLVSFVSKCSPECWLLALSK